MKDIAVVDFETAAIEPAPNYPPVPVGVAIKLPGRKGRYYAFGHPTQNNCTREEATKVLREVYRKYSILCHNAAFDVEVARAHLKLPIPKWQRLHDSMLLLYLYDPGARTISLKPSVKNLLGIEPDEQRQLRDWVLANVPEAKAKPNRWGAHISKAPGKLVGKYAISDVEYSWKLFEVLFPMIQADGMSEAYDVERQLIPIVLEMERLGVPIDRAALEADTYKWLNEKDRLANRIYKRTGSAPFNINSPEQLANALEDSGHADPELWLPTEKGNRSTSRDSLAVAVNDKPLLKALVRHSILSHMLSNFC